MTQSGQLPYQTSGTAFFLRTGLSLGPGTFENSSSAKNGSSAPSMIERRPFRPGFQALIKSSLLRLERKQNNSSNAFRIRVFLFPSSFGIETKTKSMHYRSSLENNARFQTKMGKVCSRFQTKKA